MAKLLHRTQLAISAGDSMTMQTGELIQLFAAHGYMIDQNAISYLKAHDVEEVLELFNELMPETLVIDSPAIRRVKRTEKKNVITIHVKSFKPRHESFFDMV